MVTDTSTTRSGSPSTAGPPKRYLTGVQGLRTIAALLVAIYHIWFGRVSGGVDVFFVVAGYFATLSLLKLATIDSSRRASFIGRYHLRTARRVIPSAAVVIFATVVAGRFWIPPALWDTTITHGVASIIFGENWQLIRSATDYLQQGAMASPFQQFWALSLQVQFYVIFPLLVASAVAVAVRVGREPRKIVAVMASVIFLASFAYSVYLTAVDQPVAYFSTLTRLWEFMAGVLAAILLTRELRNKTIAAALGWLGLIVLLSLGAIFDLSTMFPGAIALVPAGAAILIIVSAWNSREPRILRARPVLWFAESSFAFYLWHWPLLIFYRLQFGDDMHFFAGLAILVVSAVLAVATTKLVEVPVRSSAFLRRSATATVIACLLLMVPAASAVWLWNRTAAEAYSAAASDVAAHVAGEPITAAPVPAPIYARDDNVDAYSDGCHQTIRSAELTVCESGVVEGSRTIVLVGGSHSLQWLDAVRSVAEETDARVVSMTKSGCVFGEVDAFDDVSFHPSCAEWSTAALESIIADRPSLVVTIGSRSIDGREQIPDAYRLYFDELADAGIPVLALRDNPWFPNDVPVCLDVFGESGCSIDRDAVYRELAALDVPVEPGFTFLDTADDYCDDRTCRVVQDDVLMYRDSNHLTRTWTLTHGDHVTSALREKLLGG
ncbi:acyltransferase family protein [Microbacterium sp. BK668]|uniref:acyltransferase family protein n=1 Tax=Microbacterium sp. BK668 TaxID=2512118 RepID=UPI0010E48C30|nr:acyltransferase family protein [Microbacterium sp. BK668]TDN90539.1 peptidoglycan/LPS O-acetylase OafA/YrhL [Microbacterium sp. BK668]